MSQSHNQKRQDFPFKQSLNFLKTGKIEVDQYNKSKENY